MDIRGAVWLPEHMARGSMQNLPRPPAMGPDRYKTYALLRPRGTHFKSATCEEFKCDEFMQGFVLSVDTATELGRKQFHYVTHDRSRSHSMQQVTRTLFKFMYGPGNDGFSHKHVLPLYRPPAALVMPGDWRAQTGEARRHKRIEDWVDDSLNHHDRLATMQQRG